MDDVKGVLAEINGKLFWCALFLFFTMLGSCGSSITVEKKPVEVQDEKQAS